MKSFAWWTAGMACAFMLSASHVHYVVERAADSNKSAAEVYEEMFPSTYAIYKANK